MNLPSRTALAVAIAVIAAGRGSCADAGAAETLRIVQRSALPAALSGALGPIAVDPSRHRLFLTAAGVRAVFVVDARTGALVRRIGTSAPAHAVFRADVDRLYVFDGTPSVAVYDGSLKLVARAPVVAGIRAGGYDPSTGSLYVTRSDVGAATVLSALDGRSLQPQSTVAVDTVAADALALDTYRPRVYIADTAHDRIAVVDRWQREETRNWPTAPARDIVAIALDEARQRLYVAGARGGVVTVDTNTGHAAPAPTLPSGVTGLAFDPTAQRLYVTHDDTLDIDEPADAQSYLPAPPPARLPVHAPFAESLVRATLSAHPDLRKMGLHAVPPGGSVSVIIANGNATRIGIPTTPGDFAAVAPGTTYGPNIDDLFYNMKMFLDDAAGHRIGLLVMEIPTSSAVDAADAARMAESIRRSMSAQIPSAAALFSTPP